MATSLHEKSSIWYFSGVIRFVLSQALLLRTASEIPGHVNLFPWGWKLTPALKMWWRSQQCWLHLIQLSVKLRQVKRSSDSFIYFQGRVLTPEAGMSECWHKQLLFRSNGFPGWNHKHIPVLLHWRLTNTITTARVQRKDYARINWRQCLIESDLTGFQ
jgi:hypothetical protein